MPSPAQPAPAAPFVDRPLGRLLLCLASVALLSLAYAPINQFYLAWVGLVPWLVMLARTPTRRSAFLWSWLTGILFFSVNMWWIGYVTLPGAMGLTLYMGLWFALAALVLRGAGLLGDRKARHPERSEGSGPDRPSHVAARSHADPSAYLRMTGRILLIAAVWVATEYAWGNIFTGLPWLYLGHSQTPVLAMCQIADFASTYGVTFWVVLINAWIALSILHRKPLIVPGLVVLAILAATLGYGLFRMGQTTLYPGPRVLVVQPNFPQSNSGAKGASYNEIAAFHFQTTRAALDAQNAKPDLVAWSETMLPDLNRDYRAYAHRLVLKDENRNFGEHLDAIYAGLASLARDYGVNLLVGGHATVPRRGNDPASGWFGYNSAYLFDRNGQEVPLRYDKIHLVPFGEYMPFRESFPPLFALFNIFNPYKNIDYTVAPGTDLTVFPLSTPTAQYRFVSPICFEDVDSQLMARMFAGPDGSKRADFIVNLTNDGWFTTPQMQQHLQLATFRCIENRVPTARSVNTGVSGFVDSLGRVHDTLPVKTTGVAAARLDLDRRVAPYTHLGDLFAGACVLVAGGCIAAGVRNGMKNRKSARR